MDELKNTNQDLHISHMPVQNSNSPLFSFFAVSDLHITSSLRRRTIFKRRAAWKWIEEKNFSFGLIAGDVTNGCGEKEFSIAQDELTKIAAAMPLLVTYGNHDYIANDPQAEASPLSREQFTGWFLSEALKHEILIETYGEPMTYACRVCGVQVLFLDCAINYPQTSAGEKQLCWLDEKLSESDEERFRIVVSHFPLNGLMPGKPGTKQNSFVRDSKKQQELLEKHGNILFFTGHTHYSLDSDSPSVLFDSKNKIAYINTASVGNTIPNQDAVRRGEAKNVSGSMGLAVNVFESRILITGIDFVTGEKISRCEFSLDI